MQWCVVPSDKKDALLSDLSPFSPRFILFRTVYSSGMFFLSMLPSFLSTPVLFSVPSLNSRSFRLSAL